MSIFFADYFGALLSFSITVLYARNNIWGWPLCIISNLISLYLYYTTGIYGEAFLEIIYISLALYGLFHWTYGGAHSKPADIIFLDTNTIVKLLVCLTFGYITTYFILTQYTNSTIPHLDAMTMALSLIGQWLTARRYIENWIIWFITDLLMISMFYHKTLTGHFVLNICYLFVAIYGFTTWYKIWYKNNQSRQLSQLSMESSDILISHTTG